MYDVEIGRNIYGHCYRDYNDETDSDYILIDQILIVTENDGEVVVDLDDYPSEPIYFDDHPDENLTAEEVKAIRLRVAKTLRVALNMVLVNESKGGTSV